jgi:hypothetical protein
MVVAYPIQISLPLYLERTRKALRALRVLCVKTRAGGAVSTHREDLDFGFLWDGKGRVAKPSDWFCLEGAAPFGF